MINWDPPQQKEDVLPLAIIGPPLEVVAKEGVTRPADEEGALKVAKGNDFQNNPHDCTSPSTVHVLSSDHSSEDEEEASASMVRKSSQAFPQRSGPPHPQRKKRRLVMEG